MGLTPWDSGIGFLVGNIALTDLSSNGQTLLNLEFIVKFVFLSRLLDARIRLS